MTPKQMDALALEVANERGLLDGPVSQYDVIRFAIAYRAALAEKMEPVVVTYEYGTDREEPLYSLEDFK